MNSRTDTNRWHGHLAVIVVCLVGAGLLLSGASDDTAELSNPDGKCKVSGGTVSPENYFLPLVVKPQATPTPVSYQFVKGATSPAYLQNFSNDLGCNWLGAGGEVLTPEGNPVSADVYQVHVWNASFDARAVAGSMPAYGPSGWESIRIHASC